MTGYVFDLWDTPALPVLGTAEHFPVRRIFCVGRNYVAHAQEMGGDVDREAPWYFNKSAHALLGSGQTVPYPPGTANFHHEMEFVVALGAAASGVAVADAMAAVYGYAAGFDMTRRDRQQDGKDHRRPWDLGKDFENAAVCGPITPAAHFTIADQQIRLTVNGATRQDATLADMVWSVPEIISHLSGFYHLLPGDLIYTGTPAGVGPVVAGDVLRGEIAGLAPVDMRLTPEDP